MLIVTWREATADDRPALEAIQQEMNQRLGKDYELPDLDGKSIMTAMVAEFEGQIIGMAYVEVVEELKFCTTDPRFSAVFRRDQWPGIIADSKEQGIRWIQMPVPKHADKRIAKALKHKRVGMDASESDFFIKDLR